jgi:AcrR family transcriptional regulator
MVARAQSVAETRQRVLEAALELFGQRPYDLVALGDVAERSGIGLATILRQFESKEQLFAAAIDNGRTEFDTSMDATSMDTASANDPVAVVRTLAANYERFGDAIVRLIAQEERLPAARAAIAHGRKVHAELVDRLFADTLARLRARERKLRRAQLLAATDLQFWRLLRHQAGLDRRDAEAALAQVLTALCR